MWLSRLDFFLWGHLKSRVMYVRSLGPSRVGVVNGPGGGGGGVVVMEVLVVWW